MEDKLAALVQIVASLVRAGAQAPEPADFDLSRPDAERWWRITNVFAHLGVFDGKSDTLSRLAQAHSLVLLERDAFRIDSPEERSQMFMNISLRLLDAGLPRHALNVSARSLPADQIPVLIKASEMHLR